MPETKELTVEEKLIALYSLQKIDSKIDEVKVLRGELPIEVKDLEDEITGLEKRVTNIEDGIKEVEGTVKTFNSNKKEADTLIAKYEKQQVNVKNNREYEALTKEVEMQQLEIQLLEKKIKDSKEDIVVKKKYFEESRKVIETKKLDMETKKVELEKIIEETEKEEKKMLDMSTKSSEGIEPRLLNAYRKIRKTYKNGLAVVSVQRDSCGGCFNKVPPQKQLEIRQRKKIIVCEHCGRVLVDVEIENS